MQWHYSENGQQLGPISDAELDQFVQSGKITHDTLVWKEGMAQWQPLSAARAPVMGSAAPNSVICVECKKPFPQSEAIAYENSWVCSTCKPVFFQKIKEGGIIPGNLPYAGFWIRVGAKIIDSIIMMIVIVPVFILVFGGVFVQAIQNPGGPPPEVSAGLMAIYYIVALVFPAIYNTFCVGKWAATPGKMMLKLKIVKGDSSNISYARALGRHFAEMLSGIILYIGYIMIAFDDEKRSLHDRICDTRVIKRS
jgi:uncharacterized RDD family membrane protein YckC